MNNLVKNRAVSANADTAFHPQAVFHLLSRPGTSWFLIHMRSHVLMLSRLIVLHILSVSLTRICSGAAGDSAASPHSSLPGKIISGEANGKHPAILQDISAVYLTSRSIFIRRGGIKLNHTTSGPFIIPRFTVKLIVTESFNQSHELLLIFL